MTIGIYFIEINDKFYIGQSVNIESRIQTHKSALCKNKHYNHKLQNAYNNSSGINYGVLVTCDISELNKLESIYIQEFDSAETGLNILAGGINSGNGPNHASSMYTKEQVLQCLDLLCDHTNKLKYISELTGISEVSVAHISAGDTHSWLQEKFPEKYILMQHIRNIRTRYSLKNKKYVNKITPFKVININSGEIVAIQNIKEFARIHKVDSGDLSRLHRGIAKRVGSWQMYVEKDNI